MQAAVKETEKSKALALGNPLRRAAQPMHRRHAKGCSQQDERPGAARTGQKLNRIGAKLVGRDEINPARKRQTCQQQGERFWHSEKLAQIHPGVKPRDLIGIAVEHQGLAFTAQKAVLTDAPLGCL